MKTLKEEQGLEHEDVSYHPMLLLCDYCESNFLNRHMFTSH